MKRFEKRLSVGAWIVSILVWLAPSAAAACGELGPPIGLDDVRSGMLLFKDGEGGLAAAPTLETDVAIAVTGTIVRARVTQRFLNPTAQWMEGVYVFPLPETAAVDRLLMFVGPRVVEGQVRERDVAKRIYAEAKASGHKAALVEQERPNIFTTSVAHVAPGEHVEVMIEYQDLAPYDGRQFGLRFPLVVAPRYVPGADQLGPEIAGDAPLPVADAHRITAPLSTGTAGIPVRLSVELDPGFPLAMLYSPSHQIVTQPIDPFVQLITTADDVVPADRDFELVWAPALGSSPAATVLAEEHDGQMYALLTVLPPDPETAGTRMPRETIFVVDTSGSMDGPSLEQAKLALTIALDALQADDRFNVIQFNSVTERLFPHSVPADEAHRDLARAYVDALYATGGTEMAPALEAALTDAPVSGALRQVVFLTDGAVGNEDALFRYIAEHLGESRLFTVGIGSAPNAFFMRKAAQFGRGTFTYISSPELVSERMDALFHKLERPALADVAVDWVEADEVAFADPIPDLYAGEPLVVAVRLRELPETLTVNGRMGDAPWRVVVHRPPLDASPGGIRQLWARRHIDALMDSAVGGADRDAVRNAVVAVALEHHLVTSYTSLVAVDVTPTAPAGISLLTRDVPVNAPHGMAVMFPNTATPASLHLIVAVVFLLFALAAGRGDAPVAASCGGRARETRAAIGENFGVRRLAAALGWAGDKAEGIRR